MQVYHGSYIEISDIDLNKCQANKDFGQGFYVTKFLVQAQNWAKTIGRKHHAEGFVTEFTFYERAFEDERYKTLRFAEYNEKWLDFIVLNRDPSTTRRQHDYDIIEGPIADDKIATRIDDYLDGLVSKEDFLNELMHHEETHQICFCTLKSLQMLKRKDRINSLKITHITEPIIETLMIENDLKEIEAADLFYTSDTFTQLSDVSTGFYEKSWQEIYEFLKTELKSKITK
jgi:hypothetical protein